MRRVRSGWVLLAVLVLDACADGACATSCAPSSIWVAPGARSGAAYVEVCVAQRCVEEPTVQPGGRAAVALQDLGLPHDAAPVEVAITVRDAARTILWSDRVVPDHHDGECCGPWWSVDL